MSLGKTASSATYLTEQKVKVVVLTRHTQVMQGLSVMLGMWRTSPSFSQLASVPVKDSRKVTKVRFRLREGLRIKKRSGLLTLTNPPELHNHLSGPHDVTQAHTLECLAAKVIFFSGVGGDQKLT